MTRIRILPVISISLLVASACGSEGNGKKQGGGSGGADDPGGSRSAPAAALTADERTCEEQCDAPEPARAASNPHTMGP